jgi:hypothetical protein
MTYDPGMKVYYVLIRIICLGSWYVGAECGSTTDISNYRLLFGGFLLYTYCVPLELVDNAAPPMKEKLRWKGEGNLTVITII